jgi:hypothetical protein
LWKIALILWKNRSATTCCANDAEPIRELYFGGLGDADHHTRVDSSLTTRVFRDFFSRKKAHFGQREMQRKMVLFWGGPATVLQPRELSQKERKLQ